MKKQPTIGLVNGQLAACPRTPNCVSTTHQDLNRYMLPVSYEGLSLEMAKEFLFEVLKTLPKVKIVLDEGSYVHAEALTMVFEYVQDVEFLFDEPNKEFHFRSASRVGYTDFGSNKRRMQAIVARFIKKYDQHLAQIANQEND